MATYMRTKSEKEWKANERTGLSAIQDSLEYLIPVPLDPRPLKERKTEENFDLYYFVHTPSNVSTEKAVLFCTGGPGQIARTLDRSTTYADFLSKNGYHVVFFHLRGTGFSQIPPSANYDRFLRVDFAIEDIEAIRAHFLGNNKDGKPVSWEAVIGWSFGTVVAQKYCHKYHEKVKKLILISPLSRDTLSDEAKNPNYAFGQYYDAMLAIYRESLKEIFESKKEALQNEFGDLKAVERDEIITKLFGQPKDHGDGGILKETEKVFGSIQFVVDAYAEIQDSAFRDGGLKKYSKDFYQSLSDLRLYGSNSIDDTGGSFEIERRIGKTLKDEVLGQTSGSRAAAKRESIRATQEYQRAYYAFGIYEGINWRFLTGLRNGKVPRSALPAVGGSAQLDSDKEKRPNKWLEKIGIDPNVKIEPWDPEKYAHCVPTLILNGGADPITAGGQAERYFDAALDGARALMKFPRVGHNISLGGIGAGQTGIFKASPPLLSGAVRIAPPEIPAQAVREATGVAAGWDLPASVWLKLKEPGNLAGEIVIQGCGILQDGKIADGEDGKGNIVALIKNKSNSEIHIQGREWTLSSEFFSGTVDFGSPKPIEAKGVRLVYGTLVDGRKNKDTEFHVQPGNLKGGLKFLAFRLIPPSSIELWIQNQGKQFDDGLKNWILRKGDSIFRFKVDPPTLGKNEIQPVVVGIDGLYIDQNEAVIVEPPADLQGNVLACLDPQEDNSSQLSFKIWNNSEKQLEVDVEGWQLKCPAFSATVKLESAVVAPNTVQTVHGTVVGINWAKCLDLKAPAELEPELEMISYNLLEGNKLSLLIKNKSDKSIKPAPRDWPYVLPNADSNITDLNQALNALLYSFIILDPEQFRQPKDNTILERIASKFNLGLEDLLKFELKKTTRIRHRKAG